MQPGIQSFETVQNGCGVLVKSECGKEQWYILEDRADAVFAQYELNSTQPLYQELVGRSIGDSVIQAEDSFGRNVLQIVAITDKYCAAGKQSFAVLENQTNIKNFRMLAVPMDGADLSSNWVQEFLEGLQKLQDRFERIKAEYISGKFPFGAVAVLVNRNPVELWQVLAFGSDSFIVPAR